MQKVKNKKKISTIKKLLIVIVLAIIVFAAFACFHIANSQKSENQNQNEISTLKDLEGKKIGSLVGSICLDDAKQLAGPQGEAFGFNTIADAFQALLSGKVDAVTADGPLCLYAANKFNNISILDEYVRNIQYGFVFSKTDPEAQKIKTQISEFLSKSKSNGNIEKTWSKWTSDNEDEQVIDYSGINSNWPTLEIATSTSVGAPSVFMKNNEFAGADIDLVVQFCTEYEYKPVFADSSFDGIVMSATTGKYKMVAAAICITEERAKNVDFSIPYYDGGIVASIKTYDTSQNEGLWSTIVNGFQSTFINENRWQLFASGTLTTLEISLLSILFGTLLGFIVFLCCYKYGRIWNIITDKFMWLIKGMPVVVFLMILFYIIFGKSNLDGVFISIIGFTLIFACGVIGLLKTGLDTIDNGQREAGLALGYTESKTFVKIILPQTIKYALPLYKTEATELLKGTAIVGYIAVADLTKIGDVVRSATYDAIFPLIAVAIIYFILEALISYIVDGVYYLCYKKDRKNLKILNNVEQIDIKTQQGEKLINDLLVQVKKDMYDYVAANSKKTTGPEHICFKHMTKSHGDNLILKDIDTTINKGDIVTLIGESGCGKTTLIRCLNFLNPPTGGSIIIDGEEITKPGYDAVKVRRKVGTIFQGWNLFEHWTVIENVMRPLVDLQKEDNQSAYDKSVKLLTLLGLGKKLTSYPSELSGGQQQRVAIARTFAMDVDVVVLDEPTSALDPCTVFEVATAINYFAKNEKTLIIISHDMNFASSVSNRMFFMHDGVIYEQGSPEEILDNPQREETKVFVNQLMIENIYIDRDNLNMISVIASIENFCIRHRVSDEYKDAIRNVFLSVLVDVLLRKVSRDTHINCNITYSQKNKNVFLVYYYNGDKIDIDDHPDNKIVNFIKDNTQKYENVPSDLKEYDRMMKIWF